MWQQVTQRPTELKSRPEGQPRRALSRVRGDTLVPKVVRVRHRTWVLESLECGRGEFVVVRGYERGKERGLNNEARAGASFLCLHKT